MFQIEAVAFWSINVISVGLALMTLSVLLVSFFPALNYFLTYGKTLKIVNHKKTKRNNLANLSIVHELYVPKKWFTHFYVIHFVLSLVNTYVIVFPNSQLTDLQVIALLNLAQSIRRLYECQRVSRFSSSAKIHIFHYLVGLIFYASVDVLPFMMHLLHEENTISFGYILIPILVFFLASYDQLSTHIILSKQKKYTLPDVGLFNYVVCPHYMDECLIYFSFLLVRPCIPLLMVMTWVVINLSASANQSYIFYKNNETSNISSRYRIFPGIY